MLFCYKTRLIIFIYCSINDSKNVIIRNFFFLIKKTVRQTLAYANNYDHYSSLKTKKHQKAVTNLTQ